MYGGEDRHTSEMCYQHVMGNLDDPSLPFNVQGPPSTNPDFGTLFSTHCSVEDPSSTLNLVDPSSTPPNLEDPTSTLNLVGPSSTPPDLEGPPSTQRNLITTDYFPRGLAHFATTKDTVTSATSQVEQANNDLRLSLQRTKTTEPTTATAGTDRSSSSTGNDDFVSGLIRSDCSGQSGLPVDYYAALTLSTGGGGGGGGENNNNLPAPTVHVASAITDKPKKRKRGRPTSDSSTITISEEQIRQQFGKTRKEAAKYLGVGISKLRKIAQNYGILKWQGREKNNRVVKKVSSSPRNCTASSEPNSKKLEATEATNVIQTSPPPAAKLEMTDATHITFTADFGLDSTLIFELPPTLKRVDVEQEVAKRLPIDVGSFSISYRNENGGEWALIRCDDDLLRLLRWTKVQLRVEPIAKFMALISEYK